MEVRIDRATTPLSGTLRVPPDKSVSHRAVLFGAMAEGESHLRGVLDSADVRSTIGAVTALGASVRTSPGARGSLDLVVRGWGAAGPTQPTAPIDCGNSGTTVRLLLGVLAGWPVEVVLTGDASLSRQPMERVAVPLRAMGAQIKTSERGTLPITVRGGSLSGIDYSSPVASAQVKSAVLLAGLRAAGVTRVREPAMSRDHTERLLPAFGIAVHADSEACSAEVSGPAVPTAHAVEVPADPSSAAFMAGAAALVSGSAVSLVGVSLNPTRTGFLRVLERMGVPITTTDVVATGAEETGTIDVGYAQTLRATHVTAGEVPSLVDEIPLLALVATRAVGVSRFEGVGELRVKESDRLEAVREGLNALGAEVRIGPDWLEVSGPVGLHWARLSSLHDHRLAMTWAVAGLVAEGGTTIEGFEAVAVSYPAFGDDLDALAAPR